MLKTYQSKKFINRTININVDGKERSVTFTGGMMYPRKVCGVYTTTSAKEQAAIESHPGFGSNFILISEEKQKKEEIKPIDLVIESVDEIQEEVEETTEEITEEVIEETVENEEIEDDNTDEVTEEVQEESGVKEVFEVEKVQDAKNYLMEKYPDEFTHRQLANKTMILNAAKDKDISFPNIK